ncbi:MAG TPA: phosphopantothenoylcysteine decarboxylase, partial [Candidatus Polarisedimenticolia bacterium]|nr:phosphopantothenoylcysteine decarboxylase [Candidatus Polarisedimenticolia bacterium]
ETGEIRARALAKLREKNLDLVVANQVGRPDSGFASETNQVTFLSARGEEESLPLLSKREVAARLLDRIEATLAENR